MALGPKWQRLGSGLVSQSRPHSCRGVEWPRELWKASQLTLAPDVTRARVGFLTPFDYGPGFSPWWQHFKAEFGPKNETSVCCALVSEIPQMANAREVGLSDSAADWKRSLSAHSPQPRVMLDWAVRRRRTTTTAKTTTTDWAVRGSRWPFVWFAQPATRRPPIVNDNLLNSHSKKRLLGFFLKIHPLSQIHSSLRLSSYQLTLFKFLPWSVKIAQWVD